MRKLRGDDECVLCLRDDVRALWLEGFGSCNVRDWVRAAEKGYLQKNIKYEIGCLLCVNMCTCMHARTCLCVCRKRERAIEQYFHIVLGMPVITLSSPTQSCALL